MPQSASLRRLWGLADLNQLRRSASFSAVVCSRLFSTVHNIIFTRQLCLEGGRGGQQFVGTARLPQYPPKYATPVADTAVQSQNGQAFARRPILRQSKAESGLALVAWIAQEHSPKQLFRGFTFFGAGRGRPGQKPKNRFGIFRTPFTSVVPHTPCGGDRLRLQQGVAFIFN